MSQLCFNFLFWASLKDQSKRVSGNLEFPFGWSCTLQISLVIIIIILLDHRNLQIRVDVHRSVTTTVDSFMPPPPPPPVTSIPKPAAVGSFAAPLVPGSSYMHICYLLLINTDIWICRQRHTFTGVWTPLFLKGSTREWQLPINCYFCGRILVVKAVRCCSHYLLYWTKVFCMKR